MTVDPAIIWTQALLESARRLNDPNIVTWLVEDARASFRAATAHLVTDDASRAFVEALTQALGDISMDEALDAIAQWERERSTGGTA